MQRCRRPDVQTNVGRCGARDDKPLSVQRQCCGKHCGLVAVGATRVLVGVIVGAGCVYRVGGCTGDDPRVTNLLALRGK